MIRATARTKPVPATITCIDLCNRAADCAAQLCNENTNSTNYDEVEFDLATICKSTCTDADLQSKLTGAKWTCFFTDTCREVIETDSCMTDASYTCD